MSELQSAACRISAKTTPLFEAAVVDSPLTECALNTDVLAPAQPKRSFIRCAMCCEMTGFVEFDIGYKEWTGYFLTCPPKLSSLQFIVPKTMHWGEFAGNEAKKQP